MGTAELDVLFHLYSENNATEANLWMMYVVATLACAGFGVTTNTLTSWKMGLIASIGFIAFAYGQYVMVREIIEMRRIIVDAMSPQPGNSLATLVKDIMPLGLTLKGARLTHFVVDFCVVFLIMFRPVAALVRVYRARLPAAPGGQD